MFDLFRLVFSKDKINICNNKSTIIYKRNHNIFDKSKVDEDTIVEHGAVSMEVAMQMAEGVKSTSGSDIGIAVTGIMGPTGATTDKPVGLVYIGYCDEKVCAAKKFVFGNERLLNKQRTMQAALNMVRKQLLGISLDE